MRRTYFLMVRGEDTGGLYPIFTTERTTGLARMDEFGSPEGAFEAASDLSVRPELVLVYESAEMKDLIRAESERVASDMEKWFLQGDRPDEFKLREWAVRLRRALGESPNV